MSCRYLTLLVLITVFSQAKGYCGSRGLDANLTRAAVRAAEWLRNNHDKDGTYGKGQVNGLVFHALRVVGYNVEHGAEILHAEINKEGGLDNVSGRALAAYVLGVLATCRDPWQFYGMDLVTSLQEKLDKYPQVGFNHPFQFSLAMIALCAAGKDVGKWKYVNYIINNIWNQTAGTAHASGDTLSMHIFALKCVEEFITRHNQIKFNLMVRIRGGIATASKELLKRQLLDSTFGQNHVTAALSYQGLQAAQVNQIKCSETMKFLLSRQNPDGSFRNLGATIYVMQSLIGGLSYDVNKIACPKNKTASAKDKIRVCVHLEFNATEVTNGKTPPSTVCVKVRNGTNAHEILKLAAKQDSCYNFTAVMTMWGHFVRSICGLHQRPADKVYWMIYVDGKSAQTGVDYLRPGHGSTLTFVYKQLVWRK